MKKSIQYIVLLSGLNLNAQGPHLHARGPQVFLLGAVFHLNKNMLAGRRFTL